MNATSSAPAKKSTKKTVGNDGIITYIKSKNGGASIAQVAENFKISDGTARKYVVALLGEKKLKKAPERAKTQGVGRPPDLYIAS